MSKQKPLDVSLDPEAVALSKVVGALGDLQPDAQLRVLRYAAERFNLLVGKSPTTQNFAPSAENNGEPRAAGTMVVSSEFADVGELFEIAKPKSGMMMVLVAGYWLQVCANKESFVGQEANDILKELGHPSGNITRDMDALKGRKPALIQQIAKSGKAKQARKKYRLTKAGITSIKKMLSGDSSEGEE